MHQNPFVLKPGEKLTPQELLDRFLLWDENRTETRAWEIKKDCDVDLWKGHLCCEDHFHYSHEHDDFLRYFVHLDAMSYGDVGFDNDLIKRFIIRFKLKYDPA